MLAPKSNFDHCCNVANQFDLRSAIVAFMDQYLVDEAAYDLEFESLRA